MRAIVIALGCVIATGCGRLGFEPIADTEHDEDGDGIADVNDPCPHVAGDLADRDLDGVGDACDPDPASSTDHYLVFSALLPGDHAFASITDFTQEADDLRFSGTFASLSIPVAVTGARVEIGFEIFGAFGTGQRQVAGGIPTTGSTYYFTELNENTPLRDVAIVSYSPANGYQMVSAVDHGGFHPGRGLLRFDVATGGSPSFSVVAGWRGELYPVAAPTPDYVGGQSINFAFNGLDLAIEYVVVIDTGR